MKRLYKSTTDRKFMGVCGGLAEYLGIDATWIRLACILCFWGGGGTPIFIYILLGIVLPTDYTVAKHRQSERQTRNQASRWSSDLEDRFRDYQERSKQADTRAPRRDVTPKQDDWSDF